MSPGSCRSVSSLGSLELGTNPCALHQDDGQLTPIAATFIGQGMAGGDLVLHVTTDEQAETALHARPAQLQAREALVAGQLVDSSFADTYGTRRPEDLGTVADGFRSAAAQSRKRGFPGLREAAQTDALAQLGSAEGVIGWKRRSTNLQPAIGVSSPCPYNAGRLDDEFAALLVYEHAGVAPEVDVSNRDILHRTLLSRARQSNRGGTWTSKVCGSPTSAPSPGCEQWASLPDNGWLALHCVPAAIHHLPSTSGLGHYRLRLEP